MNPFTTFSSTKNQILKNSALKNRKKKFTAVVFHFEAAKQEHNNFKIYLKWKKKGSVVGKSLSANTSVSIDAAYVFTHEFTCQNFDQVWGED